MAIKSILEEAANKQIRILEENLKIAETLARETNDDSKQAQPIQQNDQRYYLWGKNYIQAEIERIQSMQKLGVVDGDSSLATELNSLELQLSETRNILKQIAKDKIQPILGYKLLSTEKVAPKTLLILAIAFVLGGMIGVFLVFIKDFILSGRSKI